MLLKSEMLDRMEILFPDEPRFADLRRAYIDRDPQSIHRLMVDIYGQDIDELRKAFRDDNWHKLFHLTSGEWAPTFDTSASLENGDLRKFLFEDNTWSMYRLLQHIHPTRIVETIKSLHAAGIRWDKDAMSQGQLKSKMWLVKELKNQDVKLGTVFLCAGWYGILAALLFEHDFEIDCIRSFDVDPYVVPIAEKFNLPWFSDNWKFKAITDDIHNINFVSHEWKAWSNKNERMSYPITDIPDTIINTSCEHIENFDEWYSKIPAGKIVILQTNDYQEVEEHVNTSDSLYNFAVKTPMNKVLYSGELNLGKYTRFMRIGYK
jgi:hypothetical protein